ncbi:hypothetical protein N507_2611 [Lacticaseibacillus rhamnosus DSM 14870]|nr:hypothetical protein N507_2611 [Lacticaseibacillus rhamnosus DSM 14870]EKS51574.1 hypothetical protein LRHMDP2_1356 [Lacticaseibacillus rhamnosus LRHMDP2]
MSRLFLSLSKTRTLKRKESILVDFYILIAYLSTWCFE